MFLNILSRYDRTYRHRNDCQERKMIILTYVKKREAQHTMQSHRKNTRGGHGLGEWAGVLMWFSWERISKVG